jgi:hypothetical protein
LDFLAILGSFFLGGIGTGNKLFGGVILRKVTGGGTVPSIRKIQILR